MAILGGGLCRMERLNSPFAVPSARGRVRAASAWRRCAVKVKEVAKVVYGGLKDKTSGARLAEIVKVLRRNGMHKEITPAKVVAVIEDLGPTFIKIGQLLSTHSDILPPAYVEALGSLRSNTTPEPFDVIEARLRGVYGEAFDDIFDSIDENPLGSASIAQVHRARLRREGADVAVKIRREHVKEDMLRDIQLLRRAIDLADLTGASILGELNLQTLVDELESTVREEIDFMAELANLQNFAAHNASRPGVAFPRAYPEYSTENVLVMEFIEGHSFEDIGAIAEAGYDIEELGQRIANNYMSQMIEDGLFHADPHQANMVLRPAEGESGVDKGEVVWIDCGMVGELSAVERSQFFSMIRAMLAGDGHALTDVFIEWGRPAPDAAKLDYSALLRSLTQLVNRYTAVDASEIDLASMLNDIMEILNTSRIVMPRSFVMLVRGLAALQGTLLQLSPKISILSVASSYAESYAVRTFDPLRRLEEGAVKARAAAEHTVEIPARVANLLDMAEKGHLSVGLDLAKAEQPMAKLGKLTDRLSLAIITAGLFIGSSMIASTGMQPQLFGVPLIGFLGYMGAAVLSVYIVLQIRKGL